ncbi:MAG: hypothetical protein ACRDT9_15645, partial [Agromyces sp.]
VAAEIAAAGAEGPGTFAPRFLDTLAAVGPAEVRERARVSGAVGADAGASATAAFGVVAGADA